MAFGPYQIHAATEQQSQMGVSPYWDSRKNCLYFADKYAGLVSCLEADTLSERFSMHFQGITSFVIPHESQTSRVIVGNNHYVRLCNLRKQRMEHVIAVIEPTNHDATLSFGKCDARGRLWTATSGLEKSPFQSQTGVGALYSVANDETVRRHAENVTMPLGVGWTTMKDFMFLSDALPTGQILAYHYDIVSGEIQDQKVVADFSKSPFRAFGRPGGIAIDIDNKLWVSCINGKHVIRINPETQTVVTKIELPTQLITSLCFGGTDLKELLVMSGYWGLSENQIQNQSGCGAIYRISGIQTPGQPLHPFGA